MDMLQLEVANKVYDVVVLVETHLDSSIADGEFFFFLTIWSSGVIECAMAAVEEEF